MAWTPERIKHLRKACQQGKTLTAIAKELGVSRTTVTEKIKALNIVLKDKKVTPKATPTTVIIDPEKGLTLLELKHNSCRWPIKHTTGEGTRFCGAPAVLGKSYCAKHYAIAYINLKDKSKKNLNDLEETEDIEKAPDVTSPVKSSAKTQVKEPELKKAIKPVVKSKKENAKTAKKVPVQTAVKHQTPSTTKTGAKPVEKNMAKATGKTPLKPQTKIDKKTPKAKTSLPKSTMSRLFSKLTGKK